MKYQPSPLVDDYIAQFDGETNERLTWLRSTIQVTFPKAIEDISYDMPTYRPAPGKRGILHFAAAGKHIGIYAIFEPKNDAAMHKAMKKYRTGRGTLQFKNDEPLPKHVIRQILAHHASKLDL